MEALAKMGIDLDIGRRLGELVKEQHFVDVKVEEIKMPHGPWSSGITSPSLSYLIAWYRR